MENKKQLIIIILAVAAGIGATVMTGTYVKNKIQEDTARLDRDYKKQLAQVVAQQQQKSDQQLVALAEEVRQVKAETAAIKSRPVIVQQAPPPEVKPKKTSLALRTPPGKRAVTVMINSLSAVGGLINPGDIVDVIANLNVPGASNDEAKKDLVTVMVFQNVKILAINTNLDEIGAYDQQQAAGNLRVTFALDPQESGLMKFVEKNGSLELVLRGPNENKNEMLQTMTWKVLADYILQNNGANITVPDEESKKDKDEKEKADVKSVDTDEVKPYIQIFRAGKEL